MNRAFLFVALLFPTFVFASEPELTLLKPTEAAAEETGAVEAIMGFNVSNEGIAYQVVTGGCTDKSHFKLRQRETTPLQLQLIRLRPDFCESYQPFGTQIVFTWAELGLKSGSRLKISNPIMEVRVPTADQFDPSMETPAEAPAVAPQSERDL